MVCASTHKGEDILCIKTHLKLKSKFSDIVTVIAPRHIERSHEIKELAKIQFKVQVLNHDEYISKDNEIVIINHFGALLNYFKYAKSVFIGKSMIKKLKDVGGQILLKRLNFDAKFITDLLFIILRKFIKYYKNSTSQKKLKIFKN